MDRAREGARYVLVALIIASGYVLVLPYTHSDHARGVNAVDDDMFRHRLHLIVLPSSMGSTPSVTQKKKISLLEKSKNFKFDQIYTK